MSGSNCCFLTCIQISQEAGKEVWYSHLLRNFPQFIVIHTVKGLFFWVWGFSVSTVHEEISGFKGFGISQRQTVSYLFAKEFPLISLLGLKHWNICPTLLKELAILVAETDDPAHIFYCLNWAGKIALWNGRSQFCILSLMFSWFQSSRVIVSFRDEALGFGI